MTITTFHLQIKEAEYRQRCEKLRAYLEQENLSGVVLFTTDYVLYYTGFAFIPTERPIGFVMNSKGERGMFVPRIEVEHTTANALIDRVDHYMEYPDTPHPMYGLGEMLSDMGISGKVAADNDGYPRLFGYRGPSLSAMGDFTVVDVIDVIEDHMAIKSTAEIDLLKESTRWATLALSLLKTYT